MRFAGLDIGGANIKFATLDGEQQQFPFPIWKDKHQLAAMLQSIESSMRPDTFLGVTMTAELADCFSSKPEGVEFIVRAVVDVFPSQSPLFYRTDGKMCTADLAIRQWESVAAANWHATAWSAFTETEYDSGFLIDIGSTTTDIIPVSNGFPIISKQDDFARLSNGQLLYAGVGRTPVCSLLSKIELPNTNTSIARELFATMLDVGLWRNEIEENKLSLETADGRPATREHAGQRLARMVCADFSELPLEVVDAIADQAHESLVEQISEAICKVVEANPDVPMVFKMFGEGAKLADLLINERLLSRLSSTRVGQKPISIPFSESGTFNQTAPAFAVAKKRRQIYEQQNSVVGGEPS